MKPSVLKEVLVECIREKQSILLIGPPGIGKTEITIQSSVEAGSELILSHPVVSDPTDYKGLPFVIENEYAEFLPFGDLRALMEAEKSTVFFLDDLGQARPAVQASLMQLVLGGKINGHKISDSVTFIGASNRPEDFSGVNSILEPVKSRFLIIELDVSPDCWAKYSIANGAPAELIAFIRFRPDLLHKFEPSREIKNSPCPRSVSQVGKLLKLGCSQKEEVLAEMITGLTGEGWAVEFLAFRKIFQNLPDPSYAIAHPQKVEIPDDPATLYAFTGAVAAQATDSNFNGIVKLANRLPDEFNVRLVTDALLRDKSLTKTQPFRDWFVDHQDVII